MDENCVGSMFALARIINVSPTFVNRVEATLVCHRLAVVCSVHHICSVEFILVASPRYH